jgi:hypothetical protein
MGLNNFFDIGLINHGIPYALGINHHDRAIGAMI